MTNIYDKWDQEIDTEGLEEAVEELDKNGGTGGYDEVPHGVYEVKVDKLGHQRMVTQCCQFGSRSQAVILKTALSS